MFLDVAKPKASVSDFYTFASGSGGTAAAASPNVNEVAETAAANDVKLLRLQQNHLQFHRETQ